MSTGFELIDFQDNLKFVYFIEEIALPWASGTILMIV
jgi:hypothetical protein